MLSHRDDACESSEQEKFNHIKACLTQYLSPLDLSAPVYLSIAESLVLVIAACQKYSSQIELIEWLHRLYIEGINLPSDQQFLYQVYEYLRTRNYQVNVDELTISNDPTRRYFETQLAYQLLKSNTTLLNKKELQNITLGLKQHLLGLKHMDVAMIAKVEAILSGLDYPGLNKYELEYVEIIHLLKAKQYHGLDEVDCELLCEIASSTILATMNTQQDTSLALDNCYRDTIFDMDVFGRGRIIKKDHDEVKTSTKGLMLSISPVPFYADVARPSHIASPFQRSTDQGSFLIGSLWVQQAFEGKVHPYVNGISSTTLAMIRNLILLKRLGKQAEFPDLQRYLTTFAALMVYNSGGHSFYEIIETLKLPVVRELMPDLPKDLLYEWLCVGQRPAYEHAIHATILYADVLLSRKRMHAEGGMNPSVILDDQSLFYLVAKATPSDVEKRIKILEPCKSNRSLVSKAQGVATQLNRMQHLDAMASFGVDINSLFNAKAGNMTALDLAIKYKQVDAVIHLIKKGAAIHKKGELVSSWQLKQYSPTLYYACRQPDMAILALILNHGHFDLKAKKVALSMAVECENVKAVRFLTNLILVEKKALSMPEQNHLIQLAIRTGNVELVSDVMMHFGSCLVEVNDYDALIDLAEKCSWQPIASFLVDLKNDIFQQQNATP